MILGVPIFGPDAPPERVKGRRVGNWFANLETLWGIQDSLFDSASIRLGPPSASSNRSDSLTFRLRHRTRRELLAGIRPINQRVPVHYPPPTAGGVTHFDIFATTCCLQERTRGCVF
jgi:hypothetical protein